MLAAPRPPAPMPDWTTITLSAVIAAVLAVFVAWVVAGARTRREERAKDAVKARKAVAVAVAPMLSDVREYRRGVRASMRRDPAGPTHTADGQFCGAVLVAAEGLPWWRTKLVRRRLRGLVGTEVFEMWETRPEMEGTEVVSHLLAAMHRAGDGGAVGWRGGIDRGLRGAPDSREAKCLERQLARLRRAR